MKTIGQFVVTVDHLKEARRKVRLGHVNVEQCLMATAVKASGLVPGFTACTSSEVLHRNPADPALLQPDLLMQSENDMHVRLVRAFDSADDAFLTKHLPVTVTLVDPFAEEE